MTRRRIVAAALAFAGLLAAISAGPATAASAVGPAAPGIKPSYDIWSVHLGQPVSQIPLRAIVGLACGTNGGPPSIALETTANFATCPPERSGLHEVYFKYDDEQEYIAKALGLDDPAMEGGTSMYAHPVIVSVLVDDKGIVRGIRAVTDDHASTYQRRTLFALGINLRQRFRDWGLKCTDIPPRDGESGIGDSFVHSLCTGENDRLGERLRIESRFYRRKGEEPIDPVTRQPVAGAFTSATRFELVQLPYRPFVPAEPDQSAR